MESKVNYTAVGVFIVFLTIILFILIFWLTAYHDTKQYKPYLVLVHEDVTGLTVDSPVRFNGVQVGFVKSIHLDNNNPRLVRLLLNVEPNVPITTSTFAVLNAQGITGVIYVNLKTREEHAPLLVTQAGEPYPVIPSEPSLLMQMSNVLPKMVKDFHRLSKNLSALMDQSNAQSFSDSLKNFQRFTKTLADNSELIEKNLNEMHTALHSIDTASQGVPPMLLSIQHLSSDLTATSRTINATAKRSDLVISNFLNQILPSAQEAIDSLQSSSNSFHVFMDQLQENPSMLVRGKATPHKGPGE